MRPLEILIDFLSYDGTMTNDPSDGIKIKNRVQESTVTSVVRSQLPIVDGDTKVMSLPETPCEYLLIFSDREVKLTLNQAQEVITLKPRGNGVKTLVFFTRGEVTEVELANDSGAVANLDVIIVKK